jgi:hypothetical protein
MLTSGAWGPGRNLCKSAHASFADLALATHNKLKWWENKRVYLFHDSILEAITDPRFKSYHMQVTSPLLLPGAHVHALPISLLVLLSIRLSLAWDGLFGW